MYLPGPRVSGFVCQWVRVLQSYHAATEVIAFFSADYVIVVEGECHLVSGTSASAPVIGAIITLLNDARLAHKKSPLGKPVVIL